MAKCLWIAGGDGYKLNNPNGTDYRARVDKDEQKTNDGREG